MKKKVVSILHIFFLHDIFLATENQLSPILSNKSCFSLVITHFILNPHSHCFTVNSLLILNMVNIAINMLYL